MEKKGERGGRKGERGGEGGREGGMEKKGERGGREGERKKDLNYNASLYSVDKLNKNYTTSTYMYTNQEHI